MTTKIRTLNFLPEIFKTPTNAQFLGATLDQLVAQPLTKKIEGYIGSKFGNGINAKDNYVTEPTKTRTDYQLDPGVVFTKENDTTAKDFISYPGILDALKIQGGITNNNNRLFESQFYTWDSFANLDKLINFNQYYWLPNGPDQVVINSGQVFTQRDYYVTDSTNGYFIGTSPGATGTLNPTLTLLRGGTYTFAVNQDTEFWIQGAPGVTGFDPLNPNVQTRDVLGVTNNGAKQGIVTFQVPFKDAQNNYPSGDGIVDVVSTKPFALVNGQPVSTFEGIDGITSLDGLKVLFYNTGILNEVAPISTFYNQNNYDTNLGIISPLTLNVTNTTVGTNAITVSSTGSLVVGQGITFSGSVFGNLVIDQVYFVTSILNSTQFTISTTLGGPDLSLTTQSGSCTANINQGLFEEGYNVNVNDYLFQVNYIGPPGEEVIQLVPVTLIPTFYKITAQYGTSYSNKGFFKNYVGYIEIIPYNSAILDTLYYQDGTNALKVGIIRLIDSNLTNTLDVERDILSKLNYTAPNGVVFTNGLKVVFEGDVIPSSYLSGQYYVEGVGTGIELIPTTDLIVPEDFTDASYLPWDTTPYDITPWEAVSNIPVVPDYITIARNSISKNAWSRSNRWFHVAVIQATAAYNNDPESVNFYASQENKAKRPIIEFYPNIQLFDSGVVGKNAVDFIDTRTTDAFTYVAGQKIYYPDVAVYTSYTATIQGTDYTVNRQATETIGATNKIVCNSVTGFRVNDIVRFNTSIDPVFGGVVADATYYISTIDAGTNTITISTEQNGVTFDVSTYSGPNVMGFTWVPLSTEITVEEDNIVGSLSPGQFITSLILNDVNRIPTTATLSSVSGTSTKTLLITWGETATGYFAGSTEASIIATDTVADNYAFFEGCRVVFTQDNNLDVRNKIYQVRFSDTGTESYPVMTLTEAEDGLVLPQEQTFAIRGYLNQGKTFYYNGNFWDEAQYKSNVNQAPLFNIYDSNGISLSNSEVYIGTNFKGTKLFSYGIGSGPNDVILGFPIKYSSVANIGDISFDVNLNSDTFDFIQGSLPVTKNINIGYIYDYTPGRVISSSNLELGKFYKITFLGTTDWNIVADTQNIVYQVGDIIKVESAASGTGTAFNYYVRKLGWETAIAPSTQYQLFSFNYDPLINTTAFVCDVKIIDAPAVDEIYWPRIFVYINNKPVSNDDFTISTTSNTTTITLTTEIIESTVIEIALISNQVSETAYYTIPINLNNNPLNEDVTVVNIGDIRNQYRSAFYNNLNSEGVVFGSNNYRDLGNMVPYGNAIIQNSASLALPGAFLRKTDHNLFDSLLFNSKEYIKFKTLLVDTINNSDYDQRYSPAAMLDDALSVMTSNKTQEQPFFWSDMLPNKAPFISKNYTFANNLDISTYALYQTYNFDTANYNSVLVYLTRTTSGVSRTQQLIINIDYTVSSTSPSLTITKDLLPGDVVTINEYTQTYGSFVPNTPTKLGLYPKFIPTVVLDSNYSQPTYFIRGHDGSFNKLYGAYDPVNDVLEDFRDQVLLEFEKRVYNNIKVESAIPIQEYEVTPGYFRTIDYTYNEWLQIYSTSFLDWVGSNRIDYKKQIYNQYNQFTYNYRNSSIKLNNSPIQQGYWRGLYEYLFDTSTPNSTPWEMIGYKDQPVWWESLYGPAPYTSDNLVLWNDMEIGYDYNNGNPVIIEQAIRPGLISVLPVDSEGKLLNPLDSVVGNFISNYFKNNWIVGDVGPSEFSYRRSSSYPFDLMRILALTKPAKFYNLGVDLDNYKFNTEFNQYLVNDRSHLKIQNIEIYGNGTAKTSYINWIVDYEKQVGIDATTNIKMLLNSTDVRLVYRLAGFSDKNTLKFYVEKGSPNSTNASLLIPDESYQVLLYDNQPFEKIVYSGVVVQIVPHGFSVFGNSQNIAYFTTLTPKNNGNFEDLTIENLSVKVPNNFSNEKIIVPYGTVFTNVEDVTNFLASYGAYLESQGMKFNTIENSLEVNWKQMIAEFLYWVQIGFEEGNLITINPAAKNLVIDRDSYIVQPLTLRQTNFVLNQNLYPISSVDLNVFRENTLFSVQPQNPGDTVAYGQFNISNFEHGIVFDNVTLFNDIIYNLVTGLRQNRIFLRGTKSAEWNGTVTASGFIYNQDNIKEWNKETKYTKGEIVTYKNKYWVALKIVQPKQVFDELDWKITDYNEIQKGLLPNSSTRSYESSLYYDVNEANLEKDADLLSFSLIGYRPRDYLALVDLTDITQVNVYKNMIRNKGTKNAANAFKGTNLPQGGIDYDIYENWAIKSGEFGGVLNSNFVEFKLNQNYLTGNPAIVSLITDTPVSGAQQNISLNDNNALFNYGRLITNPNVLPTVPVETPSTLLPSAGYVNFNDVKMSSYFYSGIGRAVDINSQIVTQREFYSWNYVWLANYLQEWQVLTPIPMGGVVEAVNNLNGTVTITFTQQHNLSKYQPFEIIDFSPNINGYYIVALVLDPFRVIINLTLDNTIQSLLGNGVAMYFQPQRVAKPSDIINLPLLNTEFVKNKVWVDTNNDGNWAVYRKDINYQNENTFTKSGSQTFGSSVGILSDLGYVISDANKGEVYRYTYNALTLQYDLTQTIAHDASFGYKIVYGDDLYIISQPTTNSRIYIYQLQNSLLSDDLNPYQTIVAPGGITDWGSSLAISDDKKWLYISDLDNNSVYVYNQSFIPTTASKFTIGQTYIITSEGTTDFTLIGATSNTVGTAFIATGIGSGTGTANLSTYSLSTIIDGDILGLTTAGDKFGYSLSTNSTGSVLVVGTPDQSYNASIDDYGYSYVFNRIEQTFESQYNSTTVGQEFPLTYSPSATEVIKLTASATNSFTDAITVSSTAGLSINDPVIFNGGNFGISGIEPNKIYYVFDITSGTTFQIKTSRASAFALTLVTDATVTFNCYIQKVSFNVYLNGTLVDDSNYGIIRPTTSSFLVYTQPLLAGDIVTVSTNKFVLQQILNTEQTAQIGVQFGLSTDITNYADEIIVGAPFQLNSQFEEGAVYRFTNAGLKYGTIVGTSNCNITTNRNILINGFNITLTAGNAEHVAGIINSNNISNILATATDGKLIISIVNQNLTTTNQKLNLVCVDYVTFSELGLNSYTQTQIIECPHLEGRTQFGTNLKFNDYGSFVASAPVGIRFSATTFDFTDDENLDNDTVFDNNATRWIDEFTNAGAVYMFDYLSNYNESLNNKGMFVYAQSVNDTDQNYGAQPYYGTSIDFNNNRVIVGTPLFRPAFNNGKVITFVNTTGQSDWSVYRSSAQVVDVNGFNSVQIYSAETNQTLINLDYIDPLQGKLFGTVRENLDFISNIDPAHYTSEPNVKSIRWGVEHVGQMWFDTSNVRFVNYHQQDVTYNSKYWGSCFPGSDVAVYTWVSSNVLPNLYQGPGVPYDITKFSTQVVLNSAGNITPIYFYWVRNTNLINKDIGKTLSDSILQRYIRNPQTSGISYLAALLPNTFALYNSSEYINANDSVFHINFETGENKDPAHTQYTLIRANYPDDFLPGLPSDLAGAQFNFIGGIPNVNGLPESLYLKMIDSLCGLDSFGAVVPDPYLPKAVQSGVNIRPRQSFFYNNFLALKNYLEYANEVLKQFPIFEIRQQINFLFKQGTINPSTNTPFYSTPNYWTRINWWAPGYDNSTKSSLQVPLYADLSTINVSPGTIVTVEQNSAGLSETYIKNNDNTWTRIGLTNGTIEFSNYLWDYPQARLGWDGPYWDSTGFDEYPSEETRFIIRALNEEIFIDDLLIYRNKGLILLFEYIQSEAPENQNYLPWLNKTSFIDVSHKIRELLPVEVFRTDNEVFLTKYIDEIKPYHVVVKEFLFKYTKTDPYFGNITDFDLPSQYNNINEVFISPQLVYDTPNTIYEYSSSNNIWNTRPYNEWFQNYGLSLLGQQNYKISTLRSYLPINGTYIIVDNATSFPTNGVILVGTPGAGYEQIGYSFVNKELNLLGGLTRAVNGTNLTTHNPGQDIIIDLPGVLLLNGGRGYTEPPKVTAYIDTSIYPAPKREAILSATMSLDTVLQIEVIDPGLGYVVAPEIQIQPAFVTNFNSEGVQLYDSTIVILSSGLNTGDLVQYKTGENTTSVGGLINNQWYYVRILETVPNVIIALFKTYDSAINNHDRIIFSNKGSGSNHELNLGAKAFAIASSQPIRENIITLKYDRTSYRSQVVDWEAGKFYGAYYAGQYINSDKIASSSIQLESTEPPIETIAASAQGAVFEINGVDNDQIIEWSSLSREILSTSSVTNYITLNYSAITSNASGSTIGFEVGMPVKFEGAGIGNIITNTIYYVKEIISDSEFTISTSVDGLVFNPGTAVATPAGLLLYTAQVTNTAILSINYSGIRAITSTETGTNKLTIPVTKIGTGGTLGFYTNLPVLFTGGVFNANQVVLGQRYTILTLGTTDWTAVGATSNTLGTTFIATGPGNGTGLATGFTYGGIVENKTYYVTTVCDNQTFTISENQDPVKITIIESISATDEVVTSDTTEDFQVNDSIIFNDFEFTVDNLIVGQEYFIKNVGNTDWNTVAGTIGIVYKAGDKIVCSIAGTGTGTVTSLYFGDTTNYITQGFTYYVGAVTGSNKLKISTTINGAAFPLSDVTGSAKCTNQKDTLNLTSASGSMICNVNQPLSPGQIDGQQFTLYNTSTQYPNYTGTIGNLLTRTIDHTIDTVNRIAINTDSGSTNYFYINMPFRVDSNIGGLVTGTTYYVTEVGTIVVDINGIGASNELITFSTESLYPNMPIVFSGTGIGGVIISIEYYVKTIIDGTSFTISEESGGSVKTLTPAAGVMVGTGSKFITCSTTAGGSDVVLSTAAGPVDFTQYIQSSDNPVFSISYKLGGYSAYITDSGQGWAQTNTFTIPGNLLGGTTPANDCTLVVNTINVLSTDLNGVDTSDGEILDVICQGVPNDFNQKYYFKVVSPNTVAVYEDSLLSIPVSGINFPFNGIPSTIATQVKNSGITISDPVVVVTNSSIFAVNDAIYFTGTVFGNIKVGIPYYILQIDNINNEISVTRTLGGTAVNLGSTTGSCTVATQGDYAFLFEPFYFNQSIVKFNNRVYECIVSNYDATFVLDKWQLLDSGDRRLNALDRIQGYYQPTVNMPGLDMTQLVDGITYPNSTYYGNQFQPSLQYPFDVLLPSTTFEIIDADLTSITYNASENVYVATFNTDEVSGIAVSTDGIEWLLGKITYVSSINLKDIIFANNKYVIAANNPATAILVSDDYTSWTAIKTINQNINSIGVRSSRFVAVGTDIFTSINTTNWSKVFSFTTGSGNQLNGVTGVNIGSFSGFVAVGQGNIDYSGSPVPVPTSLIVNSLNGIIWNQITLSPYVLTNKAFNAVTADNTLSLITAVGQDGVIYISSDAVNFIGINETGFDGTVAVSNLVNVDNTLGFSIGDAVRFETSCGVLNTSTTYYIESIPDGTSVTLSSSLGGPQLALTTAFPTQTYTKAKMYLYPRTASLNDVASTDGTTLIAVGNSGLIRTSGNGINWTTQNSGVTVNLNGITYDSGTNTITVVGENNIILKSTDYGITWTDQTVILEKTATYTIQGDSFTAGYGPEELVPGVVKDQLTMIVKTRAGTDWDATQYAHVGYGVVSSEIETTEFNQTIFSWKNLVQNPIEIAVYFTDNSTGLSYRLPSIDYSVDYINQTVTLTGTAPSMGSAGTNSLRIDVYTVGNGYQLVKSNSTIDPLIQNSVTGFDEIVLGCNYSSPIFVGGGATRPVLEPIQVTATQTFTGTNEILCSNINYFLVNFPIEFTGTTFGGISSGVVYYIKSIDSVTNKITISSSFNSVTGESGPVLALSNASGSMTAVFEILPNTPYTKPIVYHNGNKLIYGTTGDVLSTTSSTNRINLSSTDNISAGDTIVFSNTMFGGIIVPQTSYTVLTIINSTQIEIEDPANPGFALSLTDSFGGAKFVTNDYTISLASNGVNASLVFSNQYNMTTDYISYCVLGETEPVQYGYSLPETQLINYDGSSTYNLTNNSSGSNPTNAVVEINGLRIDDTEFTINNVVNTITLSSSYTIGDELTVTTFNDTQRQYLSTQYNITGNDIFAISTISNVISPYLTSAIVTQTDGTTNYITCSSTISFVISQPIIFEGTGFGGILTDGTVYFVNSIISPTQFTISATPGGPVFAVNPGISTGAMLCYVGGQTAVRVTTVNPHNFVTNDIIRIDGVSGSTQLNNNIYYVHKISDLQIDLYFTPYSSSLLAVNNPVLTVGSYTGGGYVWINQTFMITTSVASATTSSTNVITVPDTSELVADTPVYFSEFGILPNNATLGGLVVGTEYYIKEIVSSTEFTVSATRGGNEFVLSTDSGTMNVTQWEQTDVNRLYVTINGYRVPSSSLNLSEKNQLNILSPITSTDSVTISSMMPSATPETETYMNIVDTTGQGEVYRANTMTRTWLTQELLDTDSIIFVNDVSKITSLVTQEETTPAVVNGFYYIGLSADKNQISNVTIYNNDPTRLGYIDSSNYTIEIVDLVPTLKITAGSYISAGDNLTITILVGNTIYINGEQIKFLTVDIDNNALLDIQRGVNNTPVIKIHLIYSEVYSLLSMNRLSNNLYNDTWNSDIYNTENGDPLQISVTPAAIFLKGDLG